MQLLLGRIVAGCILLGAAGVMKYVERGTKIFEKDRLRKQVRLVVLPTGMSIHVRSMAGLGWQSCLRCSPSPTPKRREGLQQPDYPEGIPKCVSWNSTFS